MIVYIAQIQQIPESVKEAARIDGANSWQLMRYIILPLMMPAFTIGLFLSISSSFKMFDQNLALTQGWTIQINRNDCVKQFTILPLEQMNLVLHRQRQSFF